MTDKVSKAFDNAAKWLHGKRSFTADMLSEKPAQELLQATNSVLQAAVSRGISHEVPEELSSALEQNTFVFSGFKTYHELREASTLLKDDNGGFKPFERYLKDVQPINSTYNRSYLQAEYNFAVQSTQMAVKWHDFEKDGDRYLLQYRTAGDDKVRSDHAVLHNTTLPIDDPFWDEYYPPLGWNCRCTAVQVSRGKYPESDSKQAIAAGERATAKPKQKIFRFNPGKTMKVFPPKHPYLPKGCGGCDRVNLSYNKDSEQCRTCAIIKKCWGDKTKTEQARERTHYLHEMQPLLKQKVTVSGNRHTMSIGFSKYGNKHLYSDTFGRSKILQKEDLKEVNKLLETATFVKKVGLSKTRKDNIKRFYYYEATLRGKKVYLNVAETDIFRDGKGLNHERFLYSITDKIRKAPDPNLCDTQGLALSSTFLMPQIYNNF